MLNHHHHHQLYVDDFDCHSSMLSACLLYIQSTQAHSDKDLLIDLECIIDYTTHALDYAINNRITQHTKHAHITCLCLLNIICVTQHLFVWRQGVPISYVCIHAFINMHWILSCACMLFPIEPQSFAECKGAKGLYKLDLFTGMCSYCPSSIMQSLLATSCTQLVQSSLPANAMGYS